MLRKFIRSTDFKVFEKECLRYFDKGWIPSIGQPMIATHSNDNSSTQTTYILLLEKEEVEKNIKKGF